MTAEERADLLNDIQTMLIEKGYPLYVGGYEDKGELFEVILGVERKRRMNYFKMAIVLWAIAGFCDFLIMIIKHGRKSE